jgi:alpha-1,2-glucosyltransferase
MVLTDAFFFYFKSEEGGEKKEKGEKKEGKGWPVAVTLLLHAAGALLCSASLLHGSHPHPYLLADNRHYTFYLWNRFLAYPLCRAALGVAYYSLYFITFRWWKGQFRTFSRTSKSSSTSSSTSTSTDVVSVSVSENVSISPACAGSGPGPVWILGFVATACATLVPTPLLEPRYFTPVVLLAALHAPPLFTTTTTATATTTTTVTTATADDVTEVQVQVKVSVPGAAYVPLFAFAVLNAMVLAVFLLRPFQWPDGSTARFMW